MSVAYALLLQLLLWLLLAVGLSSANFEDSRNAVVVSGSSTLECRGDGQKVLKDYYLSYDGMHPMLVGAVEKCKVELCDNDSYEWILLNVAGIFRNSADQSLKKLVEEHKENFKHKEELPPLVAEQHQLDHILVQVQSARKYYNVALVCKGINAMLITQKANELETLVFAKASEIEVEVRSLRRRIEEPLKKTSNFVGSIQIPLEEEATCPLEIVVHHEASLSTLTKVSADES